MSRFKQPHAHTHTHLSKTQVTTQTKKRLSLIPPIELIVCSKKIKTHKENKKTQKTQANQQTDNTQTQQQQISGICVFNQGFLGPLPTIKYAQ